MKMRRLYNVYDLCMKREIVKGATTREIAKKLGKNTEQISRAAAEGTTFYGRYLVYISSESFEKQWGMIVKKLKRYPEAIHRMTIVPNDRSAIAMWQQE